MGKKSSRTDRDLNRATLHRIHRIFERIRAGDFPNRRKLAEELEVAEKTIHRDIEFMRDFLNAPVEYDPHRYGYYFSEPVANFPLLTLTEGELFAIFVGEQALERYVGTPFEKPLRDTFKKFTAGLSGELSFHWSELKNAISFKNVEANPVNARTLQKLTLAIRARRQIRFAYRGLKDSRFEQRNVSPYELVSVDHQWYLLAHDLKRNAIRTFAPTRMKTLHVCAATFVKPPDFSAAKYLKDSFGIFSGGPQITVRTVFDKFAAQLVRERHWHPSQQLTEGKNGTLEFSVFVTGFEEIERWLLSWGDHVTVLSPPGLVKRLKQTLTRSLRRYKTV